MMIFKLNSSEVYQRPKNPNPLKKLKLKCSEPKCRRNCTSFYNGKPLCNSCFKKLKGFDITKRNQEKKK